MQQIWAKALAEIAALLRKAGAAIFAFFAGRASVKREIGKAAKKAAEKELADERKADDLLRDPDRVERLRKRYRRSED